MWKGGSGRGHRRDTDGRVPTLKKDRGFQIKRSTEFWKGNPTRQATEPHHKVLDSETRENLLQASRHKKKQKKNQTGVPSPVLTLPANCQSQDAQSFCGEERRPWSSAPQESMDPVGRERNMRYLRPQEVHLSGPASAKHY